LMGRIRKLSRLAGGKTIRSKDAFTSAASKSVPSWNLTPLRRWNAGHPIGGDVLAWPRDDGYGPRSCAAGHTWATGRQRWRWSQKRRCRT
jgi:hypothetical protein